MKYLTAVLLLSGCAFKPVLKFKIGDCVVYSAHQERWEKNRGFDLIREIGIEKYRTKYYSYKYKNWVDSDLSFDLQHYFKQIECTKGEK